MRLTAYKNAFFDDKYKLTVTSKNRFFRDFFHINLDAIKRVIFKAVAK
jgi:hypothetical protein